MTICNLNQVEASFLKKHRAHGNLGKMNALFNEFINGHEGNLSKADEMYVNEVKEEIAMNNGWSSTFLDQSKQTCRNLVLSVRFRGKYLTWNHIEEHIMGLGEYPTDFGSCCLLVPHFDQRPKNELDDTNSLIEFYHNLKADALHGEANGVEILLDAEQFNYNLFHSDEAGFKIALHHHLDKPVFQFSSQLILPGMKTQINLKPTVSETTTEAISTFPTETRHCYIDGEKNLSYLTYDYGFRYEMNTCLIDQGIRKIIWNCKCVPSFGSAYLNSVTKKTLMKKYALL